MRKRDGISSSITLCVETVSEVVAEAGVAVEVDIRESISRCLSRRIPPQRQRPTVWTGRADPS